MRCMSAAIAVLILSLNPATACAVSISITNAGFELPVASNGQFVPWGVSLPGWAVSEAGTYDVGVMNPSVVQFPSEAPQGNNVVNMARDGRIDQILSSVLTSGQYTLSLQVGRSLSQPMSPFVIQLLAAGVPLVQTSSASPTPGTFTTVSLNYLATNSDPNLGQALAIRIDLTGGVDSGPQFYGDDVHLEYLPVPEPSGMLLTVLAAIGIGFRFAAGLATSVICRRRHDQS